MIPTLLLAAATAAAAPQRPSVLLVTLDTTRADHLGCYGAKEAATPALDALAAEGARFPRALSPAPLTFPAHVSILSGRVPRRHGVRDNAMFRLGADVPLLQEQLARHGYATAAVVSAAVLDRGLGLARGFSSYEDTGAREERGADRTVDAAIARLAALAPPFFLWVHLYDPHAPYAPPEPFASRFSTRPYDGEIAFMDAQAGRLLAAARARAGPLLVVAAGDHGESLGEHGEDGHGVFVYQATQRVPLIVAGPAIAAGAAPAGSVGLIDVAPTILDLLKLPPLAGADGRSLAAALTSGAPVASRDYELESYFPLFSYGWAPLRGLVREDTKFIDAPRAEMYDLASDPRETKDLREPRAREAETLSRALFALIEGDTPSPSGMDPGLAEQARRIASLGYVGGSTPAEVGDVIDPKDGIAWIGALQEGRQAVRSKHPAAGTAGLERLLAKNPTNLPALMTLGACYQAAGRIDDAVKIHTRALALYPKSNLTWFNLAAALAERAPGDPAAAKEAKEAYERSLAIDPRHAEAYRSYGDMLRRMKDERGERALLLRARKAGVEDPGLETRLGTILLGRRDAGGARDAFERALAADPAEPEALAGLGQLDYDAKDFRSAARRYEALLAVRPSARIARVLGDLRSGPLNDPNGARDAYRRALELTPAGDPSRAELKRLAGRIP